MEDVPVPSFFTNRINLEPFDNSETGMPQPTIGATVVHYKAQEGAGFVSFVAFFFF